MDKVWVGAALRRACMLAGRSIQEVADHLGVTDGAVSSWELGGTMPSPERLDGLATLYEMSMDTLLDRPGAAPILDWYARRRESRDNAPATATSESPHTRVRPGGQRTVRGVKVSPDRHEEGDTPGWYGATKEQSFDNRHRSRALTGVK